MSLRRCGGREGQLEGSLFALLFGQSTMCDQNFGATIGQLFLLLTSAIHASSHSLPAETSSLLRATTSVGSARFEHSRAAHAPPCHKALVNNRGHNNAPIDGLVEPELGILSSAFESINRFYNQ
eukprot:scaffold437_cov159-Amphora_coffeaeformis.AAC.2